MDNEKAVVEEVVLATSMNCLSKVITEVTGEPMEIFNGVESAKKIQEQTEEVLMRFRKEEEKNLNVMELIRIFGCFCCGIFVQQTIEFGGMAGPGSWALGFVNFAMALWFTGTMCGR